MSIEAKIDALIAALEANTAALNGAKADKSAKTETTPAKTTRTAGKAAEKSKPAHTVEEAQAALLKLKDDFDISQAKKVLAAHDIDKMANIKPEQADAVFASAEELYAELSEGGGSGDDGL